MRAVLDACVLYPTVLRELLTKAAESGLFAPLWSERILEEWRRVAARYGPGDVALAEGQISLLNARWPNAIVPPDPTLEKQLWLPDAGDIHVLATAVRGRADAIITLNVRDFPRRELDRHSLQALHPDAYLFAVWQDKPDAISHVVADVMDEARRLSGEALDTRKLLKKARLPRLGKALADL